MSLIVRDDTRRYLDNGASDLSLLERRLRFGGSEDDATTKELEAFLKASGLNMSWDKFLDVIQKRGAKKDKNLTRDGVRGKRGFKHILILEDEEDLE